MGATEILSSRLFRGMFITTLLAFALLAGRGISQASAAEEPFAINFDKSKIQLGALADLPLDTVASGASLEGTIDEAGNVTIPKGKFKMPELGLDDPVKIRGFMGIESPATGTFDRNTGQLELDAKAGIWMQVDAGALLDMLGLDLGDLLGGGTGGGGINIGGALGPLLSNLTCGFSPMDVHFTTETNSLSNGTRFVEGPTGTGAITAEWSQLGPFAGRTKILGLVDPCQLILDYLPGLLEGGLGGTLPGGIDLGGFDLAGLLDNLNDLNLGPSAITLTKSAADPIGEIPEDPEPEKKAAKLKLNVTPKKRKVRAGGSTVFTVKVRNVGNANANGVRVCLTGPGVGLLVKWRCRKFGAVAAGKTKVGKMKVRVKKSAPRRGAKFKFRLRSANTPAQSSRSRLLIRR